MFMEKDHIILGRLMSEKDVMSFAIKVQCVDMEMTLASESKKLLWRMISTILFWSSFYLQKTYIYNFWQTKLTNSWMCSWKTNCRLFID